MKARDVLQKLSDKNISVMDGTQLVVSLGDINDAIAELESMTCENCKYSIESGDGGYDFYCEKLQDYMYECQSCNKWEQK